MKKFITLLILLAPLASATAGKCTWWVDNEGFERFKCDPDRLIEAIKKTNRESDEPRVDVWGYTRDTETFMLHDRSTNVVKHCIKMNYRIVCH